MLKRLRYKFLVIFCSVFISILFLMPYLTNDIQEVSASFGTCNSTLIDATTNLVSDGYMNGTTLVMNGPFTRLVPTEATYNDFDFNYLDWENLPSGDAIEDASWTTSGYVSHRIVCPQDKFIIGMSWQQSYYNNRKIICGKVNGISGGLQWERPYNNTGVSADCSVDANGSPIEGGLMVGLKNTMTSSRDNIGVAICQQFGVFPKDIRMEVTCGGIGDIWANAVSCNVSMENHGCDLQSNINFNNPDGLGYIAYYDVRDNNGDIIGENVMLDDVLLNGQSWRTGRRGYGRLVANQINDINSGQVIANYRLYPQDDQYITFCARAGVEENGKDSDNCDTVRVIPNKPDLVIDGVVCNGCSVNEGNYFADLGDEITLRTTIKNRGFLDSPEITASERGVTFSVGASAVPDINSDSISIYSLPALQPEESTQIDTDGNTIQHTFIFPETFSSDKVVDYKVCVDPPGLLGGGVSWDTSGNVLESLGYLKLRDNQNSNCEVFRVSAALPNLKVAVFERSTDIPVMPVGATEDFMVSIENVGAFSSTPTTVKIVQYIVGVSTFNVCVIDVPAIAAGAVSSTFTCSVTFNRRSQHRFWAVVDGENLVNETSDNDNDSQTIIITPTYIDLTVSEMECLPGSPDNPGNVGDEIVDENFFCRAKVKNISSAPLLNDLAGGIGFFQGHIFPGTPYNGCIKYGNNQACAINPASASQRNACDGGLIIGSRIGNTNNYYTTCLPYFENKICKKESAYYYTCRAVSEVGSEILGCSYTLQASAMLPNGADEQEVTCDFSQNPIFVDDVIACVDPPVDGETESRIPENDLGANNCESSSLNITLPDLEAWSLQCWYKLIADDGDVWTQCLQQGSQILRIPDYVDVRFAAVARNVGDSGNQELIRGMVYSFNDDEYCEYNLISLNEGQMSGYIPYDVEEYCPISNVNHEDYALNNVVKACVDPKGDTLYGELFEKDDTDDSNCVEKTLVIVSPDLTASIDCPTSISKDVPFSCSALVVNTTDIAMVDDIDEPQGVVFYIDDEEVSGIGQILDNDCRFGLNSLTGGQSVSKSCEMVFSDSMPHTIKVCVDPVNNYPPYGAQFEEDDSNESNCAETTVLVVVPDFAVDRFSFRCPNTIVVGEVFSCSVEVKNNNPGAEYDLPVPIAFSIGNREIRRINHIFTSTNRQIDSGSMIAIEDDVTESGVVSLMVYIDPDDVVYENNAQGHDDAENNNYRIKENVQIGVTFEPDFIIMKESIICYDEDLLIQTGDVFACEAKVKNIGFTTPSENFYAMFYSSWEESSFLGTDFVDVNVFKLKPFQNHRILNANLSINEAGEYPIVVCADRNITPSSNLFDSPLEGIGVVTEVIEDNNCLEGPTIRVVDQLLPDLNMNSSQSYCGSSFVLVGETFSCSALVENIGHVPSTALDEGVVMYIDGVPTTRDLNVLSVGNEQAFNWENLSINDDGGEFPRDVSFEFCVDPVSENYPEGRIEEYDDTSDVKNNCSDFVVRVVRDTAIVSTMTLSADSIEFGQSVNVTVSATDDQGVIKVGAKLGLTTSTASEWDLFDCEEGAISCENTWVYTPDWSGETRIIQGYARGTDLMGDVESIWPEATLTVLPEEDAGGTVSFEIFGEVEQAPIYLANVRVYGDGIVGECSTNDDGICDIYIDDWNIEHTLIVQGYGYNYFIYEQYTPDSFNYSIDLMPTNEEEVPVNFVVLAGDEIVEGAIIRITALAIGDIIVEQFDSPEILKQFSCTTYEDGVCSFDLYKTPGSNKSYTAVILHPDYIDRYFEFDIALGSVGEGYEILLAGSSGTVNVTFTVMDETTERVIEGASINVIGVDICYANTEGQCSFDLITDVAYDIRVSASGYVYYALFDYYAFDGNKILLLIPEAQGPGIVTEDINNSSGGSVVNEISEGITASVVILAGSMLNGVVSAEVSINPKRPTSVAVAPAIAKLHGGMSMIGIYVYDYSTANDVVFDPSAVVSITYTDGQISNFNENDLVISYYDRDIEEWVLVATDINSETNTATVSMQSLGFMILSVPRCYDSDTSQDIDALGYVEYGINKYLDQCDNDVLIQYSCDGVDMGVTTETECGELGCTGGVCRNETDRTRVIFQVFEQDGTTPIVGAHVSVVKVETNLDDGSCVTQSDGKCTISLSLGSGYRATIRHEDYNDISISNISALEPVPQINMVEIVLGAVDYVLSPGLNLLFVSTIEPLYWSELISFCDNVYDPKFFDGGFFVYSPFSEDWSISDQINSGRSGYVLAYGGCNFTKIGHLTGGSWLISLKTGTNIFQLSDASSLNAIIGNCNISHNNGIPMFEKYRFSDEEAVESIGLDDILEVRVSYWVQVESDCSLSP